MFISQKTSVLGLAASLRFRRLGKPGKEATSRFSTAASFCRPHKRRERRFPGSSPRGYLCLREMNKLAIRKGTIRASNNCLHMRISFQQFFISTFFCKKTRCQFKFFLTQVCCWFLLSRFASENRTAIVADMVSGRGLYFVKVTFILW